MEEDKARMGSAHGSARKSPEAHRDALITDARDAWKHACAAAAHGWQEHAHHEGAPMQLTAADYKAALEAAGNGQVHEPAVSRHLVRSDSAKGDAK